MSKNKEPVPARLYKIRFHGPTNTLGARVSITSPLGTKTTEQYDYEIGSTLDQGLMMLKSKNIEVANYGELDNRTYFATEE